MSRNPLDAQVPQVSLLECKPQPGTRYYTRYLIFKHICAECNQEVWYGAADDEGKHICTGPGDD